MAPRFRILDGLPSSGPLAHAFPDEWGKLAREGVVVEFDSGSGTWTGNFEPGLGGLDLARAHPNGRDVVVLSRGDCWIVDSEQRSATRILPAIEALLDVHDPPGFVLNSQGMAFARIGPDGLLWHTRRLSFDGFDRLQIAGGELTGVAWSPLEDRWLPFQVDLRTGSSRGGSYVFATEDWERLAKG